eukprot:gene4613-5764_t
MAGQQISIEDIFPNITSNSKSESIQRLYAVLQVLTDLIKFKKAPINPTSYFALILNTLQENNYKPTQRPDLLKLFSIVISRVSHSIIKTQSSTLVELLIQFIESEIEVKEVVKPALSALGYVITVSGDQQQWQSKDFLRAYSLILKLSINDKQKIRQKAAEQVVLILNSTGVSSGKGISKQIASISTQFCSQVISDLTMDTMNNAFYCLTIVSELLSLIPPSMISTLFEDVIKLTQYNNSNLTTACYKSIGTLFFKTNQLNGNHIQQIIDALFQYPPSGIDTKSTVTYTDLLTQAYICFTKLDKKLCNQHLDKYFTFLMKNFGSDKSEITRSTMDGFRGVIFECINVEVIDQGVASLQNQLKNSPLEKIVETIESGLTMAYKTSWDLILLVIQALYEQLGPNSSPILNNLLIKMDSLFQMPEFHFQMHLQQVFITVLQSIGPKNFLLLLPLNLNAPAKDKERVNRNWLLPLMRDNIKFTNLSFFIQYFIPLSNEIKERSIAADQEGRVIESRNLEILYSQIWDLLPGFCNHPVDGDQAFKLIARQLGTVISDQSGLRITVCASLTNLISKLKESSEKKPLPYVPLRQSYYIMKPSRATEILKCVSLYSKNYLPILFNTFPSSNQDQRAVILNTIEAFVSITDEATLNSIFKTLITKLLEALAEEGIEKKDIKGPKTTGKDDSMMTEDSVKTKSDDKKKTKKYYLTDLTIGFVKHLDEENIKVLYKVIKPQLQCSDPGLQKRSFKILIKICEFHQNFIVQNMTKIKSLLVHNLMQSTANIKKTRLKCLKEIIFSLSRGEKKDNGEEEEEDIENEEEKNTNGEKKPIKLKTGWLQLKTKFIPSLIPETILCTKETNAKCRETANELILEMGNVMCLVGAKLSKPKRGVPIEETIHQAHVESIQEYIQLVSAGLASITPHMVSATIVAISRIVYHFKDTISPDFINSLITTILVLLASPHREIVKSVFGFVRVIIASYKDPEVIQPNLEVVINGLAKWGSVDKNYFRVIIQILLERLIKRFQYDTIYNMVPEDFKKVLTHIRKRKERLEKKREALKQGIADPDDMQEDGDDMGDDTKSMKSRKSVRTSKTRNQNDSDSEQDVGDSDSDGSEGDIEEFLFNVKRKKDKKQEDSWIVGEGDEPIDFMDRNVIGHLLTKPSSSTSTTTTTTAAGKKIKKNYETDEDGRLLIEEEDEDKPGNKKELRKKKKSYLDQVFEEQEEELERKTGYRKKGNKRMLDDEGDQDDSDDDIDDDLKSSFSKRSFATKKSAAFSHKTINRIENATTRYNRTRSSINPSYETKSQKSTKGDNRKKNEKFEPYAYIPLDPKALNKRKKSVSNDKFKNIVSRKRKKI